MSATPYQKRNLNPHKPSIVAMWLWGSEYANQNGGCMDLWDTLPEGRKSLCREMVKRLAEAPEERVTP